MSKVGQLSKVSEHFMGRPVIITSDIWKRDPDYPVKFLPHVGYDYRAAVGEKLISPFDGEVVAVVDILGSSYGRQVYVYDGKVTAHFAHLSRVFVKQGQKVEKGDIVGASGRSGQTDTTYAPHLHFGLAKGKVINAGYKGSRLGEIWLDVEEYDFDDDSSKGIDHWRNEGGVFELTENVNERTEPSTSGKLVNTHSKGTKINYVAWGNSDKYTWFKLANGNYVAFGERGVENYGKDHPGKAASKPVAPKPVSPKPSGKRYITLKGRVDLYDDNSKKYATPSGKTRTVEVIKETGSWYLIRSNDFSPSDVWVKKSDVDGSASKPVAPKPVSRVGKYANFSGSVWLFEVKDTDATYPAPSKNKKSTVRARSAKILEEGNGRVRVSVPSFSPSTVWLANSQISVTDRPIYRVN